MKDTTTIVMIRNETLLQSVVSDVVTLAMIAACVYVSGDSLFWQVVCLGMFFIYLSGKGVALTSLRFRTKEEMKKWAENI